ncbi:hypothetical protein [Clostridium sporogenes]|uniref:Uncharacterized protein n=1 Tax=Clostridium sporogenes TaxID=1509 RepID=A0A6G4GV21_CLOSG|nr:hypothetical protein [Clostridium sporogenes]KOY64223.1 hypothetical protein AN649_19755 [Clostridium sporogenes]NFF69450.1 hypothetical protein [Clostridium sporogenes]NFS59294.1 hypothetical protein [Clostridium sporogenes]NFT02248.1 hypothetical protein [Clostridium sporogenes]NFT32638.1 hypothetical protein [Clostridium sporogenes]
MFNTLNRCKMIYIIEKLTKESGRLLYKEKKYKEAGELVKITKELVEFYDKNYGVIKCIRKQSYKNLGRNLY